jgi:transcriptional regulator with XRE-family HTH domain
MRLIYELGAELRHARLAAGLSQASVAAAAGVTQGSISRLERAKAPHPDIVEAARIVRLVGLELSVRCYPAPGQLRDAAHVALIGRLLGRLGPGIRHHLEVPIQPGDQRAWDVLLTAGAVRIGVIAETRIRDLQALLRREHLKQAEADSRIEHLLLLVSNTRHNRTALAEACAALSTTFPLAPRAVLASLGRGEAPEGNGVVIL